jgi:hypothetical protein
VVIVGLRIITSFEVGEYQNWQMELLYYSYQVCRQPGLFTVLASLKSGVQLPKFPDGIEVIPTRWVTKNVITGDRYPPYNKPASFCDYFSARTPQDEYLLLLDPDMVFVRAWSAPFDPPVPVAEDTGYMDPSSRVGKRIIARHCQKNKEAVQPIGFPILIHEHQLRWIVDRWHILTEEMRQSKETVEDATWICEMWAFSVAAAEAGVRFNMGRKCTFSNDDLKPSHNLIHYTYPTKSRSGFVWDKRKYHPWDKQPPIKQDVASSGVFLYNLIEEYRGFRDDSVVH